jgi:GH24 family phage-related lysozyme (muramidase)
MQESSKKLLKADEGFSLIEYPDTNGHMTIYYGHKIQKGEVFNHTQAEGEKILDKDIAVAEKAALNLFPEFESFIPNRQDALIMLLFNMGASKIGHTFPTFVHNVNIGDWEGAGKELHYADGKTEKTLSKWFNDVHATRAWEIISMIVNG